jgi:hypothetical protein
MLSPSRFFPFPSWEVSQNIRASSQMVTITSSQTLNFICLRNVSIKNWWLPCNIIQYLFQILTHININSYLLFRNIIPTCCGPWLQSSGIKYKGIHLCASRDSSFGIATRYGLDGPRIESRCGRDFPRLYIPALRPTQPPIQRVPGLSREQSGRSVALITHPIWRRS